MQAKFSAGIDCLRFPQVTGGNLPALAGNLREASIERLPLSSSKQLDQIIEVNGRPAEVDFVPKQLDGCK